MRIAEVKVANGAADPRVLHVDVSQPDGKFHPAYSTDLICPDGKGTIQLPFVLNDPAGEWQVRVIDVASGVAKTMKITLQ